MNIFFYWILISSFLVGTLVGFIISDYIKENKYYGLRSFKNDKIN